MNQNDLPLEVELHRIGPCPVCGKGQMLQGTAGWTCDYFRTLDDKCTFTIFSEYQGYRLTEEDAVEIITDGQTGPRPFMTRGGVPFTAVLQRQGQKVRIVGDNAELDVPCPVCGAKVRQTQKGFACSNYFQQGDSHCPVWVNREICGRTITRSEVEQLLERGYTEVLDGFTAQGKAFSSCLKIDLEGNAMLDGEICRCPKCGSGKVFAGIKGFNCSNYRNPGIRCDFVIWRNTFGHIMLVDEVKALCYNRQTGLMTFTNKEGKSYQRHMIINSEGNVKLV